MGRDRLLIIKGIPNIQRALDRLPKKVQADVIRPSMRAGMQHIEGLAKALAPVETGTLRSEIRMLPGKRPKRGKFTLDVRVDANVATTRISPVTGKKVFYPAVQEFGSPNIGVPADEFMYRAFDVGGETALTITLRHLMSGINREIEARSR
jgi:hypothetical protein